MSITIRAIHPDEREECIALWKTVFRFEDNDAYFRRYFYGDVEWLPYYTQVAVLDGKLVSAVHIVKRTVACGPFRLTMGGIANVATLPAFRGQGYNFSCLQRAIQVMEADAFDFSLLFTGIHDYYAKENFDMLRPTGLQGQIVPDWKPRPAPFVVRNAVPDDMPAIQAIYADYNAARPIAVERSPAYWRDWIGISPDDFPDNLLVAAHHNTVTGYALYELERLEEADSPGASVGWNMEFGALPVDSEGREAVAEALYEAVAAKIVAAGRRTVSLNGVCEPAVRGALQGLLTATQEYAIDGVMVRLLHRDALLKSLTLPLNERWIAAGRPPGMVTFETPYGQAALDANGDFLRVTLADEAKPTLHQSAFFGLLFGYVTPHEATQDPALRCLFAALFPPQYPVYWNADGF